MLLVYVTCENALQAKQIAKHLLEKKLCACANIISSMESLFFWPPGGVEIEEAKESILLIKTFQEKYDEIEEEIKSIHSYEIPCIFSIKATNVSSSFHQWMKKQMISD
jgi:periplasmic divalent cation tolerance protein